MAKPWSQVADSAEFKALAPDQQEAARAQYFDQVVAPRVPKDQIDAARSQFDAQTGLRSQEQPGMLKSFAAGVGRGVQDVALGAQQLAGHGLQMAGDNMVGRAGRWLTKDAEQGIARGAGEVSPYQQAHPVVTGAGEVAGNIAATAPLAAVMPGAGASTLAGRAVAGAGLGAAQGALQPVQGGGNFATEKLKQIGEGAGLGAAAPAVGQAISRTIAPKIDPAVQYLTSIGVKLTPGQALGGAFKRLEEGATSIPFLGDAIKNAQRKGIESFNTVAINRALEPIGGKLPAGIKSGHEAVEYASDALSGAYDALLPKMRGKIDPQFNQELQTVKSMASGLPPSQADQLNRIIDQDIVGKFTPQGNALGETVKEIEEKLGGMTRDFGRSDNPDVRRLGDATKELQASLRRMLDRSNPQLAPELQKINKGYANLLRVQAAAARTGAKEGTFTPAQLRSASRQLDTSKNKRAFSQGKALMQDLAEKAGDRLSPTLPDSGTAFREMVGAPHKAALGIVPGAVYSMASGLATKAITAPRSAATQRLAEGVRRAIPLTTPALIPASKEPEQ
jgi:hypothetical protein